MFHTVPHSPVAFHRFAANFAANASPRRGFQGKLTLPMQGDFAVGSGGHHVVIHWFGCSQEFAS
jgi:hypothetical protein